MKECAIIGRPNSGKTMFALGFTGYLGTRVVDVTARAYDGLITSRHYRLEEAKAVLSGSAWHKTRCLQTIVVNIPLGKGTVAVNLTDTCGVSEEINGDASIRKAMAQTLALARQADIILHIVDAAQIVKTRLLAPNIDQELYQYGLVKGNYAILANKMDLPVAREGLKYIRVHFPHAYIMPVSALHGQGFKEVRAYVAHCI